MPQIIDRPQVSLPVLRCITHPHATYSNVVTARYNVVARLFDEVQATDTLREFDVLIPAHLGDDAIERLLKSVTNQRYQVHQKIEQTCSAF